MKKEILLWGSKTLLQIRKHGPTIATIAGIATMATGTVAAVQATWKVKALWDDYKLDDQRLILAVGQDGAYRIENRKLRVKFWTQVMALYTPTIAMTIAGSGFIWAAHTTMKKRYAVLAAAYATLQQDFSNYQKRFRYEIGSDDFAGEVRTTATGEQVEIQGMAIEAPPWSVYSVVFGPENPNFAKSSFQNRYFLERVQEWMNNRLLSTGFVFLNDVYEALGFPKTPAGQIVGWVKDNPKGNGYVNFGFDKAPDFMDANLHTITLDFNVDGIVFELI